MSGVERPGAPQDDEPAVHCAKWFDDSDQKLAKAYLASMVALPVAAFLFVLHDSATGLSRFFYGSLITFAAWPPTIVSWRVLGNRSKYSWLAFRAQAWCLVGGATRQAIQCIRSGNRRRWT
jgi:hypothetical protein